MAFLCLGFLGFFCFWFFFCFVFSIFFILQQVSFVSAVFIWLLSENTLAESFDLQTFWSTISCSKVRSIVLKFLHCIFFVCGVFPLNDTMPVKQEEVHGFCFFKRQNNMFFYWQLCKVNVYMTCQAVRAHSYVRIA